MHKDGGIKIAGGYSGHELYGMQETSRVSWIERAVPNIPKNHAAKPYVLYSAVTHANTQLAQVRVIRWN